MEYIGVIVVRAWNDPPPPGLFRFFAGAARGCAADDVAGGYDSLMTGLGSHYHIGRPTGVCAATGDALAPGDAFIATLAERDEDDGFDRHDYALEAWENGARPERLFSYWRTVVPDPEDPKDDALIDDDVLIALFERLAEDERPQRIAFRFVLALILMRKRLLKYVGRETDDEGGDERWLMYPKGVKAPEPPLEVVNPHLSDEDVRDLLDQLGEILRGEF